MLALAATAYAECPNGSLEVLIEGNKKTKSSVVLRIAGLKEGCISPEGIDAEKIKQNLLNSHIFSKVEVVVSGEAEKKIVRIIVKERWSILPVPIYYQNEEETGGGLFILETNLLGRKKLLAVGGTMSNIARNYNYFYIDDSVLGSKWVIVSAGVYSDAHLSQFDDEEKFYVYRQIYNQYFLALGYKITEHFMPGLGLMYRYQQTFQVDDYIAPPEGGSSHAAILNIRYDNVNFKEFYDEGININALAEQSLRSLGVNKDVGHQITQVNLTYPLWKLLTRTRFESGWSWGDDTDILTQFLLGGFIGNRGLPSRGLWVDEYGLFSETIEEKIYSHKYAVLTLIQFYDVTLTAEDDPIRSYHSAGAGFRIYLKELAAPAVGMDAAYSFRNDVWRTSAFIGGSF